MFVCMGVCVCVCVCVEHDRHGTLGVIVNHPSDVGGPVPSAYPTYLTDFASSTSQPVAGIPGIFFPLQFFCSSLQRKLDK
jgi:hypothetical protein